jgi:hypothetical protein
VRVLPGADPCLDVCVLVECEAADVGELPRVRSSGHPRDVDLASLAEAVGRMSALANSDCLTATLPPPAPPANSATDSCGCGHLDSAHDVIAARFCAATQAGALSRGCICHPGPTFRSP